MAIGDWISTNRVAGTQNYSVGAALWCMKCDVIGDAESEENNI